MFISYGTEFFLFGIVWIRNSVHKPPVPIDNCA